MNIFRRLIILILIVSIFTSCAYVKTVTVPSYFKFEKETTLCVDDFKDGIDNNITSDLNYYLTNVGFNVITLSSAKKAIQYKGNSSIKYINNEIIEVLSVKNFSSVYEIKISLKKNVVDRNNYSNHFQANVIDMNTGKTVLYYFNGSNKSLESILKSFTKKLSEKIN